MKEQELVNELETLLVSHDWYYDYSDDIRVFKKGIEQKKRIKELMVKTVDAGMDWKASVDLYNKYAPENYKLSTNKNG